MVIVRVTVTRLGVTVVVCFLVTAGEMMVDVMVLTVVDVCVVVTLEIGVMVAERVT